MPAIPNVPALPDDAQPMARLRDCLGMHERAYPPRVMRALRELIEKRPKNVSLSEDNGYWMPTGSRLEFKVCPRDSAVPTDWRHRWSRKWTWSLWPVGNVPGTWIWMADEEGVAPSDMHIWPSTARPILALSYLCPTETYKAAQHASICHHVQSGRKHSRELTSTCLTCLAEQPPRETKQMNETKQRRPVQYPSPPLREITNSMQPASCPTRVTVMPLPWPSTLHCPGTCVAPSHWMNTPTTISKLQSRLQGGIAWDKKQRLGEADNPGPEPPRELYLDRKNGQRDPIRLCKQNGGWVWNVHSVPPLRVAKRSTPQDALRNWLNKHENAITPASAEAARQLAKEWEAFPMPQPVRRTRSMPPRETQSLTSDSLVDGSPPRENPLSQSQPDPPIRRRLRGKTPGLISPGSPPPLLPGRLITWH